MVEQPPVPVVEGYAVRDFVICNSWISAEDGFGQEQERKRRFSFGVRGDGPAPNLRRWIVTAALLLPKTSAVLGDARETPVAIGGSGKVKPSRQKAVVAWPCEAHDSGRDFRSSRRREPAVRAGSTLQPTADYHRERQRCVKADQGTYLGPDGSRERQRAVDAGHTGPSGRPKDAAGRRGERRTLAEMCRLQGLPEDFLADAPFTVDGKRKAIANGVPLPMGRAVARAVRAALEASASASVDLPEVAR